MKLVIGLGNPGNDYEKTRHNIGFMAIDAYANYHKGQWASKDKFKAEVCQLGNVVLVKPQTFMNLSGEATQAITSFYKIPVNDVLVVSDDIDLEFGKVRARKGGGDGGHNGLKSIIKHIGGDFWRLRIGVANEVRDLTEAGNFVLNKFSIDELGYIQAHINKLIDKIDKFTEDKIEVESFTL